MNRHAKPLVALSVLALAAVGTAIAAPSPDIDHVWVDGKQRSFVVTGSPKAGVPKRPLYVIAPVNPAKPLHPRADAMTKGFGAHDHVIRDTAVGALKTTCDLHLVVPGPRAKVGRDVFSRLTLTPAGQKPLLYSAVLGGRRESLDSAARIAAAAKLGLATLVDVHVAFACTIEPAHA